MRTVELSPLGWLAVAVPLASTIVFFVLAKDLPLARRFFAAIHGVAAVAILPVAFLVVAVFPEIGEAGSLAVLVLVGGVAATSIFYSIATVSTRWFYHLLHVPTVAVIAGGFVLAMFLLAGH